jgi:hypothetical protein
VKHTCSDYWVESHISETYGYPTISLHEEGSNVLFFLISIKCLQDILMLPEYKYTFQAQYNVKFIRTFV